MHRFKACGAFSAVTVARLALKVAAMRPNAGGFHLATTEQVRKRPALFRALGEDEPPQSVTVGGEEYLFTTGFKHDSWAATALYTGPGGRAITVKLNRQQPALGIPLKWLGRRLAAREATFLRQLAHVELVPDELGPVYAGGKLLDNACARVFVEGDAFRAGMKVGLPFFTDLREVLDKIHAAGIAYVDLHKRENIIIDRQGRPHLIDFQVSLGTGKRWPRNGRLTRFVVRKLQEMDDYHYRKHYVRCLPELLTKEERELYSRPPALIRAHRKIAVPLRSLRRRLLVALKIRGAGGQAESELEPEDAFRTPQPKSGADGSVGG
jgi:hypothetical protein